MLNFMSYYLAG